MKHLLNKSKNKENLEENLNSYIILKSKTFKNKLTIKEINKLKCDFNNEIFHYYWWGEIQWEYMNLQKNLIKIQ